MLLVLLVLLVLLLSSFVTVRDERGGGPRGDGADGRDETEPNLLVLRK